MTDYRTNPELALPALEKLADEIPSGVSEADVARFVPQVSRISHEVNDVVQKSIVSAVKSGIQAFWVEYGVQEKINEVKNLRVEPGFRQAFTPQDLANACKARNLRLKAKILEDKIAQLGAENSDLQQKLVENAGMITNQLAVIKAANCSNCQDL